MPAETISKERLNYWLFQPAKYEVKNMDIDVHNAAAWYFSIINALAIVVYGWDKLCAIRKWWCVPELALLGIATIGGSVGALVAMQLFHHKTLHLKFKYGVPLILALQIAGLIYLHMVR